MTDRRPALRTGSKAGGLSIIIPTYQREPILEKCLSSLAQNSDFDNEIIVSSPVTGAGLSDLCDAFGARLISDSSRLEGRRVKSLWKVINECIELAMNDFVCWLNDDCLVNPHWDTTALHYFDPSIGIVVLKAKGVNKNPDYDVGSGSHGVLCANYAILRKSAGIRFDEGYSWFYGDADISLSMAFLTDYRVVGTSEGLVIHDHVEDVQRRDNELDPRTRQDRAYFERKWTYKKRKGDRIVSMNIFEECFARGRNLLREGYHRLRSC